MKHLKLFGQFINEAGPGVWAKNESISRDAAYIHGILQTGQDSAQNFIDDNGLDGEKLSDYVKANRNNIDGYNVKHYISGERGTVGSVPKLRQAFIKKFKKGNKPKPYSFFNEGKYSSIDLRNIVDILSNSMEEIDETEFADLMTDYGWDQDVSFEIFNSYWNVDARDRMKWGTKEWTAWLKKHGINV